MTEHSDESSSFEVGRQDGSLGPNDGGEDGTAQLAIQDSLLDRGLDDPLDEGYSPPDHDPHSRVPTQSEQAAGLSLAEQLAAENPDVYELAEAADDQETEAMELGTARAGRLVDTNDGTSIDTEKALIANDVGYAGGAASAEEAAMHIFDPDGSGDPD